MPRTKQRPRAPRVQVILPVAVADELAAQAAVENKTISRKSKELIEDGLKTPGTRADRRYQPDLA